MSRKMDKRYFILILPLIALAIIGILSGNVYSLGHYKERGGPGGTVVDCNICHDFENGYYNSPDLGNLRWVRQTINGRPVYFVKFSSPLPADGTLADGNDAKLDGPCEVCHTKTDYHTNFGDGKNHFDAVNCTACHPHFLDDIVNYFEPRFIGTQSHITHFTDPKGPQLGNDSCTTYCHNPSDFHLFKDGQPLATTTICNPCHSKGGAYDGVGNPIIGAKPNWEDAIYEPPAPPEYPWPYRLKAGKENWCAGCHDNGSSIINGVPAPNVMGDNTTYGYNVSGHGRNPDNYIRCDDCHDLTVLHTDGNARTYSASNNNYKSGYRLNESMAIPRYLQYGPNAFKLCFKCHVYSDVFGPVSNFRDDREGEYLHKIHLDEVFRGMIVWDSDWDGVGCSTGACADSAMSCTACHNIHGSPCLLGNNNVVPCPDPPKVPMIRHGELISTPGTTDKVPALRFNWYDGNNVPTTDFNSSRWGGLLCGPPENVAYNHVCWGCHTIGEVKYYRTPGGPEMVTVHSVWTTDTDPDNTPKTIFAPGDPIRYHVGFSINGPSFYYTKANGVAKNTTGASWSYTFSKAQTIPAGDYDTWKWDKTVPLTATPGSNAKVTITVKMFNAPGGTLISSDKKSAIFSIK